MKIKAVILFSFIFLVLCNVSTFAQTKPPDSARTPAQPVQYQGQIDTLRAEFEKVKKDAYEKAIEGANKSISVANTVVVIVALIIALAGYLGISNFKEVRREIDKLKAIREEWGEKLKHEKEEFVEDTKKGETPSDFSK